jgi:L-aspartate oxidase
MNLDVIVVGAGVSGLMCALDCAQAGMTVGVVYRGALEDTSSFYAQGGVAAAWDSLDSVQQHAIDTQRAGDGLCQPDVVEDFCAGAPALIQRWIELGVPFDTTASGKYSLTKEGAHSFSRIFHVKDYTGSAIVQVLASVVKRFPNVTLINGVVDGLLLGSNGVAGVKMNGQHALAKAIVMASGGFSNLFSISTNPIQNIGEGIALAYCAGAPVGDLEFIQFHPTVVCALGHRPMLVSEALRGEGAVLVNQYNEPFMKKYHALGDLAPRDVVSRAVASEPTPMLNIDPIMPHFKDRFPTIYQGLIHRGFLANDGKVPVQPLVHYTLGGIVAHPHGATGLPGLYAIGECAVTGFHGANRLASNSLLEAGIMGQKCAQYLMNATLKTIPVITVLENPPLPVEELQWLGEWARRSLGVIRDGAGLNAALQALDAHADRHHPMHHFFRAVIESAALRCESRGGHYRSDYPNRDPNACHSRKMHVTPAIAQESHIKLG